MKVGISSREQRTILAAGALSVIILVAYVSIVGRLMREAMSRGREVRSAREQLKVLEAATANEAALREQYREVSQTVESLRRLLSSEEELPAVIERVSGLATETGVRIQAIFPQRPVETAGAGTPSQQGAAASASLVYKEIPIQVDALTGYHQLGAFLSQVESGEKPTRVSNLRIAGNQKDLRRHSVKLVLRSYFTPKEEASGKL